MASNLTIIEHARQRSLLDRKLQNVPERHVPKITIHDILYPTPRVLHITTLPSDLQLPYFLRNRALINHDSERPIKDERRQPLKLTRAIFFYHLSEAHQFQRFHDMARWNIAMFTALLTLSSPTIPSTPTAKPTPTSSSDTITPAAHRFITIYLSAVLERHNTPTLFTAREAFIKRWKTSPLDLFTNIKASQRKLLKKALARLNTEWERELDIAVRTMDRKEYDARVAPFVGSVIPGRKDQGLMPVPEATRDFTRSAGPSPEAEHEVAQGGNEILDALCVPLDDGMYRDEKRYEEDVSTPVDIRVAIATVQRAVPRDVLRALMRAFPVQVERWGSEVAVMREGVMREGERMEGGSGAEMVVRSKYCG